MTYRKLSIYKPLTKIELFYINKRIDEIEHLFNNYELDTDIIENLDNELKLISEYLENSEKICIKAEKLKELNFKIVS